MEYWVKLQIVKSVREGCGLNNKFKIYSNLFIIFLSVLLLVLISKGFEKTSILTTIIIILFLFINLIRLFKSENNQNEYKFNKTKAYLKAFEHNIPLVKIGNNFDILYANRAFYQLLLCTKEKILNLSLDKLFIDKNEYSEVYEILKHGQSWEGLLTFKTCNDKKVFLNCSIIPIKDKDIKEYILIANDLTELMLSKKIIKQNLYIDSQTKLPNRLKLIEDKKDVGIKSEMTLILFNIDSFQAINSLYGNSFGDQVLTMVAKWLENNLPTKSSKLYKFEADVYAILIPTPFEEEKLKNYLDTVSKKISQDTITCMGVDINITFTIGAAQGEGNLLKLVFIAYKEAKKRDKTYMIYDKKSNKEQEYIENINMSNIIKESIKEDKVVPYFQPIMNLKTNEIEKYETLMRIKKDGGVYLPSEFLDIAKYSKLYPTLSKTLIEKAFETFQFSSSEFSVNLSFLDIVNQETMDFIFDALKRYNLGSWVVFELLESEGIENYEKVYKFVEIAKSYGAKIAIDDFGSGYSNFERLVKLKIDYIKIDGSLIKNIDKNDDMRIITQTIINFAKELNIKTIAEYVHSKEILDIVTYMGVDFAQGYHIGKPSPTPQLFSEHLL